MNAPAGSPAQSSWRIPARAWWVLAGCLVCQMGLGCSYVFSPILKSVVAELDWSRTGFAAGRAPLVLAMSLSFPVLGWAAERYGARRVLSGCTLLLGLAFVLLSRMQSTWEFLLINAMLGVALAGLGDVIVGAVAARWVPSRAALVLGVIYVGSNLGGALVARLAAYIQGADSWRTALVTVGVGGVLLILPFAAWAVKDPPARLERASSQDPDAGEVDLDLTAALRTRSFWVLAFVLFCFYFYYVAMIEHLVPFLTDTGLSNARAATNFSGMLLVGIAGKLLMGWLADRANLKAAALLNFAILTGASFLLLRDDLFGLLAVFVVAQGFATSAENVLLPALAAGCFGPRHLSRIYGALMVTLFAGVLGGIFAARIFDVAGSYRAAFATFAVLNVVALTALVLVRDERRPVAAATRGAPAWT